MKKIITAFIFCFLCGECFSQAGEWVWIKGDSVPNQAGNYGVQGVPSPTNNPPSLYEPCEWTDLNGNFWLFGGSQGNHYGDLWKYDLQTNEWTWMKGSGVIGDPGEYGIQGVPSMINNPPARGSGVTSWVDNQNNLWLFGGLSGVIGEFSDLWKFNISTNEWTWIKGPNISNQSGIYGIQGIPDPTNNPSARTECVTSWIDSIGNLWLFGGFTNNGVITGNFNDLWRYDISSNTWTWMKGSQLLDQLGVYNSLGIEDSQNTPGARMAYSHWKKNDGTLWLFGGLDFTSNHFNDLWRFNLATNNWSWMGGDSSVNALASYGTKCFSSLSNIPGSRFENRTAWKDQAGNFWSFGGAQGIGFSQVWNDLWMYCITSSQWIWISGDSVSNPSGDWGIQGISNPVNIPNGRSGAVGWSDNNNHFYFFGGGTHPYSFQYNDLWKYTIDTTCGVCPVPNNIQENNFTNDLLVFPNPTNSSLTISFSSSEKQSVELSIYNTLGKEIYFSKEEITKGKFEKEINVKDFSKGIYLIRIVEDNDIVVKKFVKE